MSESNIESIDVKNDQSVNAWAKKFDATPEQIQSAVAEVGNHPDDVEMHLKGSRASSNSEKVASQTP